jgi:hypothetical protein
MCLCVAPALLQLAKLHVVMYPWQPAIAAVVRAVAHIRDEDQQKQRGRGQPKQEQALQPESM